MKFKIGDRVTQINQFRNQTPGTIRVITGDGYDVDWDDCGSTGKWYLDNELDIFIPIEYDDFAERIK